MTKKILGRFGNSHMHWVGDGFPVRTLFSYDELGPQLSPFLLLDYGGPHMFAPAETPRGVGQHPHRGFETVTVVYDGEVEHKDSRGNGGIIGPGDVQWMTAGRGILHEEFHSQGFTKTGGPFRVVQLWVNLPAKDKRTPGSYQAIEEADIPTLELAGGAGTARIIAGELDGTSGPATTFTRINIWDVRLAAGAQVSLPLPEGHTSLIVVLSGSVSVNGSLDAREAEVVSLERKGSGVDLHAEGDTMLLVLTGEPIDEPIVGRGPFVMNTEAEIVEAYEDFRAGRFAEPAA